MMEECGCKLKILFINQLISEYGQSFLYDGLRRLGHQVIDFPQNYRFHFKDKSECLALTCKDGPCSKYNEQGCTNHPAHLTWPIQDRFDGLPDLVITNNGYGQEELHREIKEKGIPIAALDLGDSVISSYKAWCDVIGCPPDFFFRREYLQGQEGKPLSYSFYDTARLFLPTKDMQYSVSFMFRPTSPERKELAEKISKIPGSFVGQVPHSQYLDILGKSRFSIAVKGAGYDTVRRWEIPCRGSVLCTDKSPIVINNDFEDGISCIKFENADELIAKINSYLNSYDVYNRIRANCYNHFERFHTTIERARQFLKDCGF